MNALPELGVGVDLGSGAGGSGKIVYLHVFDIRSWLAWSLERVRRICCYLFREMASASLS